MTKIKLCGLSRTEDIETVNELKPEYVGFVFAPESRRYVTPQTAAELRQLLSTEIQALYTKSIIIIALYRFTTFV